MRAQTAVRRTVSAIHKIHVGLAIGLVLFACPHLAAGKTASTKKSDTYQINVSAPNEADLGKVHSAQVELLPRGEYKVNMEYPLKLEIKAPSGINAAKRSWGSKDALINSKERVILKPRFTAMRSGTYSVEAKLRFSVCSKKQCLLHNEHLKWVTKVKKTNLSRTP